MFLAIRLGMLNAATSEATIDDTTTEAPAAWPRMNATYLGTARTRARVERIANEHAARRAAILTGAA